ISSSLPGPFVGCTTATVGTAIASVSFASASASPFFVRRVTAPAVISTSSTAPTIILPRLAGAGGRSGGRSICGCGRTGWLSAPLCCCRTSGCSIDIIAVSETLSLARLQVRLPSPVNDHEHARYKKQSRDRRKKQAANHRPAQRSVLLAAFSEAQRHWHHTDDHGQRRHQHRAHARVACFDRRLQ